MNGFTKWTGSAIVAAVAVVASGCYHAVIETGRPTNGTVIEDKWADSFVEGLAPPDVVETAERCPNGVARVETEHSVLNMIASFLTFGIYTPMHITVHCAAARSETPAERVVREDRRGPAAAVQRAVALSADSGEPVYVMFAE